MAEGSPADHDRERVMAAVQDEIGRWGIDRFNVAAMAHRHGLDVEMIRRHWPDSDLLVLEALAHRIGDELPPPDTGSLLGDLYELAVRMVAMITPDSGRRLHGGHLIVDTQVASVETRQSAWRNRADTLDAVFERARRRGELRQDVDSSTALELLFAPINMRVLYTGESVDDGYCRTLATLVCRAVAP